jgi:LacI family transcriptional regulator, repressor for deo operon, udp, cdd, tsx, nupC, and nupG
MTTTSDGPRPARIKDVAARAGVSLKTVTNVVHDRPYVRAETRQRVQAAIEELGYRPSLAGRRLQSGRSNTLTLVVPRIDEPYLGALAHAMIAAATPRGYTVLIDETGAVAEREALAASGYPGHGIDGVIFSPAALFPHHLADMSHNTPMVLLGEYLSNSTADHVAIDNVGSAREVVLHLLQGGRRQVAFLGSQPDRSTGVGELRALGYRQEMADAGLEVRPEWTAPAFRFSREEGEARAEQLVREAVPIDALVCASDLLAIGAMRAFRRHGISVPEDVAVVGWDNTIDAAYHLPGLTSVASDMSRLAELTLDAVTSRIEGNRSPGISYVVPHELVVRESSSPTAGARTTRQ